MKLGLKYKILLPIISLLATMYIVTMGYIINKTYDQNTNDGKLFIDAVARENANMIAKNLSREINITRTLSHTFEISGRLGKEKQKKLQLDILKNTAEKNPDFLSVGLSKQLFTIDKNWKHEYGRERYIYYRTEDKTLLLEDTTLDKNGEDEKGLYYKIHKEIQEVLLNPYFSSFNNSKQILMTSICVPVKKNYKFTGLTVIDISLERLKDIVLRIKPVMKLNAFLLSNNGTYIVHEDSTRTGKFIGNFYKDAMEMFRVGKSIEQGKSASFVTTDNNNKYYLSFVPIKFGGELRPWSLAVAVPMSELTKESRNTILFAFLIGIVGLVITIIFIIIIANSIIKPVLESVNFTKKIANGDLTAKISGKDRNDELGELTKNLQYMVSGLKNMIGKVKQTVSLIRENSNYLKNSSIKFSKGNNIQTNSAEQVFASMQEMSAVIEQNTGNAEKTAYIAGDSAKKIMISEKNATFTAEIMNEIAEKIELIDDLAFQTNILSLNTAIEASHAGEFEKGFTVISKEVRKLARKSKELVNEIKIMSEKSLSISQKTSALLKNIAPNILETSELVNNISVANKTQNTGALHINNAINNLNKIIQENTNEAYKMAENSKILTKYADYLSEAIELFKT